LGLLAMGLKRRSEFFKLGVLRHLWQRFQNLLLGVVESLRVWRKRSSRILSSAAIIGPFHR
jgi:hypothetical protein